MYDRFSAQVCAVGRLPSVGGATFETSILSGTATVVDDFIQPVTPADIAETPKADSKTAAIFLMFLIFFNVYSRIRAVADIIFVIIL